MAKPIFLVGIPSKIKDEIREIQKVLENKLKDYHVLVYSDFKEELSFECFYEKDFNEVKFEELKSIVIERMSAKE